MENVIHFYIFDIYLIFIFCRKVCHIWRTCWICFAGVILELYFGYPNWFRGLKFLNSSWVWLPFCFPVCFSLLILTECNVTYIHAHKNEVCLSLFCSRTTKFFYFFICTENVQTVQTNKKYYTYPLHFDKCQKTSDIFNLKYWIYIANINCANPASAYQPTAHLFYTVVSCQL